MTNNKFKSVKTWALIWACAIITYIVISEKTDFMQFASLLAAVPISYSYFNVKQKELMKRDEL